MLHRNTIVMLEAYAASYEQPDQQAQVDEIRKICQGQLALIDQFGMEPTVTEEFLIQKCNLLKR